MRTVLSAGVFDYFHPGHRFFLESAKALGDTLIVIIARDKNVERIKNIIPKYTEQERKQFVEESDIADTVLLGKTGSNFLEIIKELQPDVLAVGYDQKVPESFPETFPDIDIIQIQAKNPEKWKSSKYRE